MNEDTPDEVYVATDADWGFCVGTQFRSDTCDPTIVVGTRSELARIMRTFLYDSLSAHLAAAPTRRVGLVLSKGITAELLAAASAQGADVIYATRGTDAEETLLRELGFVRREELGVWAHSSSPEAP